MAVITEDQRSRLGGRTLETALMEAGEFSAATRLLFSPETSDRYRGQWVAVYRGEIMASSDFDTLLERLASKGIPSELAAIAQVE